MRNEKLFIKFLRDRRLKDVADYTIPSEPVFLHPDQHRTEREEVTAPEGGEILR